MLAALWCMEYTRYVQKMFLRIQLFTVNQDILFKKAKTMYFFLKEALLGVANFCLFGFLIGPCKRVVIKENKVSKTYFINLRAWGQLNP